MLFVFAVELGWLVAASVGSIRGGGSRSLRFVVGASARATVVEGAPRHTGRWSSTDLPQTHCFISAVDVPLASDACARELNSDR